MSCCVGSARVNVTVADNGQRKAHSQGQCMCTEQPALLTNVQELKDAARDAVDGTLFCPTDDLYNAVAFILGPVWCCLLLAHPHLFMLCVWCVLLGRLPLCTRHIPDQLVVSS